MSKLTKREKTLLLLVGAVGLVAASIFLVMMPLYNHWMDLEDEYIELTLRRDEMQSKLATEPLIRNGYDRALLKLGDVKKQYPSYMHNNEIMQRLRDAVSDSRMQVHALNLAHMNSEPYSPDPKKKGDPNETMIYVNTATLTLAGTYGNLQLFIDRLDRLDYIRLNRMSFSAMEAKSPEGTEGVSVILEVMMLSETASELGKTPPEKEDGNS